MKRIGFTGAQGTGKTTLADLMENDDWFGSVARPPSPARMAAEYGMNINRDADPLSQSLVTMANIAKDLILIDCDWIVSERTPIDSLAYTRYQIEHSWAKADLNFIEFYWEITKTLSLAHMGQYDEVFYFPPYFEPVGDGTRDTERKYQMEIDLFIHNLIDANEFDVHIVPDVDPQERLEWIKGVLRDS